MKDCILSTQYPVNMLYQEDTSGPDNSLGVMTCLNCGNLLSSSKIFIFFSGLTGEANGDMTGTTTKAFLRL